VVEYLPSKCRALNSNPSIDIHLPHPSKALILLGELLKLQAEPIIDMEEQRPKISKTHL
jgi:hypothetical protein